MKNNYHQSGYCADPQVEQNVLEFRKYGLEVYFKILKLLFYYLNNECERAKKIHPVLFLLSSRIFILGSFPIPTLSSRLKKKKKKKFATVLQRNTKQAYYYYKR